MQGERNKSSSLELIAEPKPIFGKDKQKTSSYNFLEKSLEDFTIINHSETTSLKTVPFIYLSINVKIAN